MILMSSTGEVRMRAGGEEKMKEMGAGGGDGGVRVRRGGDVKGVNVRWRTLRGSMKDRGMDEG